MAVNEIVLGGVKTQVDVTDKRTDQYLSWWKTSSTGKVVIHNDFVMWSSERAGCVLKGSFIIAFMYNRDNINKKNAFSLFLKCFRLACFQFCLQSSYFILWHICHTLSSRIILNILNSLGLIIFLKCIIFWYRKEMSKNKQVSLVLSKSNSPQLLIAKAKVH